MNKKKILMYVLGMIVLFGTIWGSYYYVSKINSNKEMVNIDRILKDSNIEVIDEDTTIDWSTYDETQITLNNKSVNITKGGIYTLTGTISNGNVTINTDGNVKLILDNVTITNNSGPAIIIINAKNTIIELKDGTTNTLTDGSSYANEEYDGCIYSADDLIIQGNGKLVVNANYLDGIVSNDDLKIVSGTYVIKANDDGIRGKDSVYIVDGAFTIKAGADGVKSTNDTDADKGNIRIDNGTFNITTVNDAIQAVNKIVIYDGTFNIKTTGNTNSASAKGVKADSLIDIVDGEYVIDTTDDGIHTNGKLTINGGKYTITSKDDGIHADGIVEINNGIVSITASEGIEATYVKINDGEISINASDDGINAGRKSNDYDVTVEINGGKVTIKMGQGDTDGIDSNGNIYINGGTINITGQSPFDYDGEAKLSGGTLIVNGEETKTITNQFGGGMQGGVMPDGQGRQMPNGNRGGMQRQR